MHMHNPLRSEADAFRWVVVIGGGAVAVIALTLLTRPVFGVVFAAALIGFGCGVAWRNSRGAMPGSVELTRGRDGRHRILVVANETVGGEALLEEMRNRAAATTARSSSSRPPCPAHGPSIGPPTPTKPPSSPASGWSSRCSRSSASG